ncbi:isochorismatase family protein [Niveomyces insectorum RCEF 264]|uniref:nicotinamidase n=1 Tax=Niveomyces insectorum RCEF 264 TaxID=1081102 RepID=A0A167VR64_9HYPO|nr:isochorismatase family protein [Niveomyces insectorum RCEF 264]
MAASAFRPALVVVDVQEDFCPPSGALAVPDGRAVVPVANALLALPRFVLRVATKDWHPPNHISFAANHRRPENNAPKQPFVDTATVVNPRNPDEAPYETRLWPVHCVQGTPGAALVAALDPEYRIDIVVEKGTDPAVEMYSAFYDPFTNPRISDSGLADLLRHPPAAKRDHAPDAATSGPITHVFVVGLAADYCVRSTALDALKEGFVTYIVEDGTRAVDPVAWPAQRDALRAAGVGVVGLDGPEVARLRG